MNLYLMRHGIAEDLAAGGGSDDSQRELTEEGERKVRDIARRLCELEISFDLIVTSPYRRARQTAEIVHRQFKRARLEISDQLIPGGRPKKLFEFIHSLGGLKDDVLLVGYEPYLSELAASFIFGQPAGTIEMKKGGICKIRIAELREGRRGVLEWLLTPKLLRKIE